MRKLLLAVSVLLLGVSDINAQYIMNVRQTNGNVIKVNVADIEDITWEEAPVPQYEYVDLGLSVMWATCNVGASSPEDYGDYYAWGETEKKSTYDWSNYKYCNGNYDALIKYCTNSSFGNDGYVDNKTFLDSKDDVANELCGNEWRVPNLLQWKELLDKNNCLWIWTSVNGILGYRVVSKINGNAIFLPAAGTYSENGYMNYGNGSYWSSELRAGGYDYDAINITIKGDGWYTETTNPRFYGFSVRPIKINKIECVDLGLSVKWATCNVGASKPEDYGGYYAWGEIEEKSVYDWNNYKYCNGSSDSMTKYCTDFNYGYNGFADYKTTLDLEDDVAHINWGGNWRMPTDAEWAELMNNCIWIWTIRNGTKGFEVKSQKAGYEDKSIFIPAAGYRVNDYFVGAGFDGYYWYSSLCESYSDDAWYMYFSSSFYQRYGNDRYYGRSVRPVCP